MENIFRNTGSCSSKAETKSSLIGDIVWIASELLFDESFL